MYDAEDFPDKTLSELDEEDREKMMEGVEEFHEDIQDLHGLMEAMAATILLGRMFKDEKLTLQEYMRLVGYVEEYERDLDRTLY